VNKLPAADAPFGGAPIGKIAARMDDNLEIKWDKAGTGLHNVLLS
jgi:hypothetical protein